LIKKIVPFDTSAILIDNSCSLDDARRTAHICGGRNRTDRAIRSPPFYAMFFTDSSLVHNSVFIFLSYRGKLHPISHRIFDSVLAFFTDTHLLGRQCDLDDDSASVHKLHSVQFNERTTCFKDEHLP